MSLFVCYTTLSYVSLTITGDLFFLRFVLSWKNEILSAKIPAHGNAPFCLGQIPTPCVFRVVTPHVESCWCGRLVPPLCGRAILQSPPNNGPWKTPQMSPQCPPPLFFMAKGWTSGGCMDKTSAANSGWLSQNGGSQNLPLPPRIYPLEGIVWNLPL